MKDDIELTRYSLIRIKKATDHELVSPIHKIHFLCLATNMGTNIPLTIGDARAIIARLEEIIQEVSE